ncbi:acyltransferase family protein [Bradyrhizobium cenepequi]|uniref:acyltransferase family protein n=1 Tax=Bradyrhizobium cenepequi TaxID=2821403 RepID=UPI001CE3491F|nr:acyltransferase [Bradyrhizobium cenepequi]MCA6106947.1 acyltransferase [Bradyrhizobium cenepequi]
MKQLASNQPQRYFLLDLMRGVAALTVLIWHYQHFFMTSPGVLPASFSRSEQPLYWLLFPFYNHGNYAVQLFFSISGFIFFSEYLKPIGTGAVSAWNFFVLRFSRIYPLHFVTLLVVSILQCIAYDRFGRSIVYENNDAYHFVLNVLLASHWGWENGFSFNAPIWSVSIEALLYFAFFVVALVSRNSSIPATALCVLLGLAGAVIGKTDDSIGLAMLGFFNGGLAAVFLQRSYSHSVSWAVILCASVLLLAASLAMVAVLFPHPSWTGVLFGAVFPTAVLTLAALQYVLLDAGKSVRFLGDISYSVYLVHFPIQLLALLLIRERLISLDFHRLGTLLFFLLAVMAASWVTYRSIEAPAKRAIRRAVPSASARSAKPASVLCGLDESELGAKQNEGAVPRSR